MIGTAAISAGQASITVAFSGVGTTHMIEASYDGSAGYATSGSANQTVTVVNPTATAKLTAKALFAGKRARGVSFQIIVQAGSAGLPVPSGRATLEIGRKKFKTVGLANGSATVFVPTAKAKGKTFVVDYLGDSTYKAVVSNSFHVTPKFLKKP